MTGGPWAGMAGAAAVVLLAAGMPGAAVAATTPVPEHTTYWVRDRSAKPSTMVGLLAVDRQNDTLWVKPAGTPCFEGKRRPGTAWFISGNDDTRGTSTGTRCG